MSQAFVKILGGDSVVSYSAGSKPSGIVNPKANVSIAQLGYDVFKHMEPEEFRKVRDFIRGKIEELLTRV